MFYCDRNALNMWKYKVINKMDLLVCVGVDYIICTYFPDVNIEYIRTNEFSRCLQ